MAKKPKTEKVFGLEIGMAKTDAGKQVVIVDRDADLFVVWHNDNGDTTLFERFRSWEEIWRPQKEAAERFLSTGEWPKMLKEQPDL